MLYSRYSSRESPAVMAERLCEEFPISHAGALCSVRRHYYSYDYRRARSARGGHGGEEAETEAAEEEEEEDPARAEVGAKCTRPCMVVLHFNESRRRNVEAVKAALATEVLPRLPLLPAPPHHHHHRGGGDGDDGGGDYGGGGIGGGDDAREVAAVLGDPLRAPDTFIIDVAGDDGDGDDDEDAVATVEGLELLFQRMVVREDIHNVVGVVCSWDSRMPMVDYFSARLRGASVEQLAAVLPSRHAAAGAQPKGRLAAREERNKNTSSCRWNRDSEEGAEEEEEEDHRLSDGASSRAEEKEKRKEERAAEAAVALAWLPEWRAQHRLPAADTARMFDPRYSVAARVNLFGNDPATSRRFRQDKRGAQQQLAAAGLNHIRSVVATSAAEAEARRAGAGIDFPVIVKPVSGAGSEFVSLCRCTADVAAAFEEARWCKTSQNTTASHMVVEEYIEGDEYVVDTVSHNGVHAVTDVWRSWKDPVELVRASDDDDEEEEEEGEEESGEEDNEEEQSSEADSAGSDDSATGGDQNSGKKKKKDKKKKSSSSHPRRTRPAAPTKLIYDKIMLVTSLAEMPPDSDARRVTEYTLRALDALGMRNGCAHCEVRVDRRRPRSRSRRRRSNSNSNNGVNHRTSHPSNSSNDATAAGGGNDKKHKSHSHPTGHQRGCESEHDHTLLDDDGEGNTLNRSGGGGVDANDNDDDGSGGAVGRPVLIELNPRLQGGAPRSTEIVGYDQIILLYYLVAAAAAAAQIHPVSGGGGGDSAGDAGHTATTTAEASASEAAELVVPWPPVPQLYTRLKTTAPAAAATASGQSNGDVDGDGGAEKKVEDEEEADDDTVQTRGVIFLRSAGAGALHGLASVRMAALPTFVRVVRGHLFQSDYADAYTLSVRPTVDLFTSPGAMILGGTAAAIARDMDVIRQMEDPARARLPTAALRAAMEVGELLQALRAAAAAEEEEEEEEEEQEEEEESASGAADDEESNSDRSSRSGSDKEAESDASADNDVTRRRRPGGGGRSRANEKKKKKKKEHSAVLIRVLRRRLRWARLCFYKALLAAATGPDTPLYIPTEVYWQLRELGLAKSFTVRGARELVEWYDRGAAASELFSDTDFDNEEDEEEDDD